MPTQIQRPQVAELLTRFFRLTGRVRPSLDDVVIPTVQIGDLTGGATPPIIRSASAFAEPTKTAGERATWRLEAPPGTLLDVKVIWVLNYDVESSLRVHFGTSIATPPDLAPSRYTDGRITGSETPAGILLSGTQAGLLANYQWLQNFGAVARETIYPNNWIVGTGNPGTFGFLELQSTSANNLMALNLQWDEYQIN